MAIKYAGDPLDKEALPPAAVKRGDLAKKDKPRKGGDRKRPVQEKAPEPPPAGAVVEEIVRVSFPLPVSLLDRIKDRWHERKLTSLSATIRALLEEALKL